MKQGLLEQLGSFDDRERRTALQEIAEQVARPETAFPPPLPVSNMHLHTFYSFNAESFSPARLICEAARHRLEIVATVDFDVLDSVDETLLAADLLRVKASTGIETRVFISDHCEKVINSPKEPGIYYLAGVGFTSSTPQDPFAAGILQRLREIARNRTVELASRVNDFLDTVRVDFDRDVVPLTPAGNATERHLLRAYDSRARAAFPDRADRLRFWAEKLNEAPDRLDPILDSPAPFHELMRARLMKFGSVGYVPPQEESFPSFDDVVAMTRNAGAVPSATFLDGTSDGENDVRGLMEYVLAHGVEICTLIPDRNWRIADPDLKKRKLAKLAECVHVARDLHMPLLAGTEMNKPGQPFVDEFDSPDLAPYAEDFIKGARLVYGHTVLARARDAGLLSDWSRQTFGDGRKARNDFYTRLGTAAPPGKEALAALADASDDSPGALIERCRRFA